jgi:hypothetical protein
MWIIIPCNIIFFFTYVNLKTNLWAPQLGNIIPCHIIFFAYLNKKNHLWVHKCELWFSYSPMWIKKPICKPTSVQYRFLQWARSKRIGVQSPPSTLFVILKCCLRHFRVQISSIENCCIATYYTNLDMLTNSPIWMQNELPIFYKGKIHVALLLYIPIFYINILCYPIIFLGAKILAQNNTRCQLYLRKNHISCQ